MHVVKFRRRRNSDAGEMPNVLVKKKVSSDDLGPS